MRASLVSEYRKLVSTRLWWILLLAMTAYVVFLAVVVAFSMSLGAEQGAPISPLSLAATIYGLALSLGYTFPAVVGALAVTSEFRHKTITPTLLAEPRRGVVLGAKYLASLPVGFLFGLAGTAATTAAGAAVLALRHEDTFLGEWVVQRGVLLSVVGIAVWTMVGVGLGAMLPNQVLSIIVLLVFTQFVEPILRALATQVSWGGSIAQYLPGAAGDAMSGGSFYSTMNPAGIPLLPWWAGLLVLLGYAAAFGLIGRFTTFRRDIT